MELSPLSRAAAAASPLFSPRRNPTPRPTTSTRLMASSLHSGRTATPEAAAGKKPAAAAEEVGVSRRLELSLSPEMRRRMVWRMLAPAAAALAAEAAFLRLLGAGAAAVPGWVPTAGSWLLFGAGLVGFHYGFLSSRWDAAEEGSFLGWELAVRHWDLLSVAMGSSQPQEEESN